MLRAATRIAADDSAWLARAWAISAIAVTGQMLVILLTNYSMADVNRAFVLAYAWGVCWALRSLPAEGKPQTAR